MRRETREALFLLRQTLRLLGKSEYDRFEGVFEGSIM